ncbi:MAG: beta-mannosidase [Chlorobi bacterium]|nr:beta-mannosidase [Chlorobiota bacterium]
MKPLLQLLAVMLLPAAALAQSPTHVRFSIDAGLDTFRISPYVYGSNAQGDDPAANIAARRAGGNRWTGYNWENNASHAGTDFNNQSDNYMTYTLADSLENKPGIVPRLFHQESISTSSYSLITLPAAGYVAKDKSGVVSPEQTAPSVRWAEVKPAKGSPFLLAPDTGDNIVYADEEVNALVNMFGKSNVGGVRGYAIDNEPALWPTTHPRIHPAKTRVQEVIDKGVALARAVKGVDAGAEMFGPVAYGYAEFLNCQDAPDWSAYSSYGNFLGAYLAKMKEAEAAYNMRLLDVLDLHWYPEARGKGNDSSLVRIVFDKNGADPGVQRARMQAPRSLWDSTFREDSWIGQYFSPVALIPAVRASIARYYPGTKLAFTEYNYGGDSDISGGIAVADVLGIFGKYGVYMSNYWGTVGDYISTAYRIYRNYDGHFSAFGDINARAVSSDNQNSSVHASASSSDRSKFHIVAINKSMTDPIIGSFSVRSDRKFTSGRAFAFDGSGMDIREIPAVTGMTSDAGVTNFTYTIAPLTVVHLVLESVAADVPEASSANEATLDGNYPNPATGFTTIGYSLPRQCHVRLRLLDALGREILATDGERAAGSHREALNTVTLPAGAYFYQLQVEGRVMTRGFSVVK